MQLKPHLEIYSIKPLWSRFPKNYKLDISAEHSELDNSLHPSSFGWRSKEHRAGDVLKI